MLKVNCRSIMYILFTLILFSCNSETELITPPENTNLNYNSAYEDSVLFTSTRGPFAPGIYIMHKDGTGMRNLNRQWFTFWARWSPDKRQILFVKDASWDKPETGLYVMDSDGKNERRLTPLGQRAYYGEFAPDGSKIAYLEFDENGLGRIRVMNTDGSESIPITDWYVQLNKLSWSNTSRSIVFTGTSKAGSSNMYFVFPDGSHTEILLNGFFNGASWSPDGTRILYSKGGNYVMPQLYIYNVSTKSSVQLYSMPGMQLNSSWSKDGKEIIFDYKADGYKNNTLYKINSDGTNLKQITDGLEMDWLPCWYK